MNPRKFLSTPSARRATNSLLHGIRQLIISIHALREEGDFLPMIPAAKPRISIHALREEGDRQGRSIKGYALHFYPRPPRGGRPQTAHKVNAKRAFLSTPSARRATSFTVPQLH